ncbi:MAG: peptidyl-prolyl cis-trans isomerase, partial [Proteobacteria bacterium]|nr:peptidyl-prolyl cis-trans isomerase [Pseudomonadota bacterium]
KQAEAVVPQIPAFQVDGKFSEQRFMQVLNATLFSPESFLDSLQAELMRNQMSLGISESAFALPIEVDQAVQLIYQKRDMSYAILTLKQFIPQVKITESLIQDFYKANQQEFTIPEQVRLEYLELSLNDLAKAQHISQKEAQQKFADMNEQLANLTFSNPDSLQPAAKALKLTIKQTGFFAENSKQNDKQSMTANPKVIAAAFNPDVLGRKNNSDVIPVSPTDVVVLRIKEHIPAGTRSLNEVRSSIVKRLTEKQAVAMAQLAGEKILKALQSGATQQSIAKEYGLQWQSASQVTRNDMKINSAVVAAAFAAGVPHDKHVKPLKGVPLPQGDYAIVQVSAVYPGSVKNLKSSEATTFRQQLQSTDGVQEYALYVQGLLQNAKIVINGKTTPWRELVNAPAGEASSVVNRDSE